MGSFDNRQPYSPVLYSGTLIKKGVMTTDEFNKLNNTAYSNLSRGQKQALKAITPKQKDFKQLPIAEQLEYTHGNLIRLHKKVDGLLELLENTQ